MNIQCFFSISKHITLIGKPFMYKDTYKKKHGRDADLRPVTEKHQLAFPHLPKNIKICGACR